jgi:hypothetical protein
MIVDARNVPVGPWWHRLTIVISAALIEASPPADMFHGSIVGVPDVYDLRTRVHLFR